MIANQVARIPITPKLSRHLLNHLPTQCMLQLLKSHAFAKNKLHTKKWIIGQVRESIRPIHPLLPEFTNSSSISEMSSVTGSTFTPTSGVSSASAYINLSLISEQELVNEFTNPNCSCFIQFCAPGFNMKDKSVGNLSYTSTRHHQQQQQQQNVVNKEEDLTPQLLFLYYALFVYDYQLSTRLAPNRHRLPDELSCVYSDKLWDIIPITYLLQYARSHLSDYRALYPKLLQ
ncbi:unnamed protein product [Trichobilharzia regenti]|nr:unnamed protein product [Trichobilharzia regenti]